MKGTTIKLRSSRVGIFSALLFLWLLMPRPMQAQTPVDGYLTVAAEHNPALKGLFNEYLAALEKVPQVGGLPDPMVSFNYFVSPVETRLGPQQFSVMASQMFPWFGTLSTKQSAATAMAKAKYEAFVEARNKLFYQVKATYYDWYVLEKNIQIIRENLDLFGTYKEMATIKFESGKAGLVDPLRVDMEIEELETRLAYMEDSRIPLGVRFEELLNQPIPDSVQVAFPDSLTQEPLALERQEIIDSIVANNPQFRQLDFQQQAFLEEERVARKMGSPSFNLGLSYINIGPRTDMDVIRSGTDAFIFPQVGITIPIYRGKYKAQQQEARYKQEAVDFKTENLQNQLKTGLEAAIRDYQDAERRTAMYRRLIYLANKSKSLLVTDYSSAGKDFEEVLRMEGKVLDYQLELEKARADLSTAIAQINYLIGK